MNLASNYLSLAPNQQDMIEVHSDGKALQQFLAIHPPDDASNTPPILAFKRKREVEIPWDEIIPKQAANAPAVLAIQKYFEESWESLDQKWPKWKIGSTLHLLETAGTPFWYVRQLSDVKPVYRPDFDNLDEKDKPRPKKLVNGFVMRHAISGRLYLLITPPDAPLSVADFSSFDNYESAWQRKIEGAELVFESEFDAQTYYIDFEEIDLRPAIIQRKYEELRIVRDFASKVKENVARVTDKMITRIIDTTLDPDELEQLQRRVLRLEIGEYDAQRRIERLSSDAARLGYLLLDKGTKKVYKDNKEVELQAGKLYTTYKRTARWTEHVSKRFWFGLWFGRLHFFFPKEEVVEDYKEVDTSKDILEEKRSAMTKAGLRVYVFEQTPSGLVSAEGEALQQIMLRCKYDEDFRRSCVVILPVYEDSLTGQRLLTKYVIYKRPLPGMVATILPRLSLEESLTYRTAWVQTQLGELLNSINLAPDEERKVTITKRFEQETMVTRTSTSIFDISRTEASDLATEMENQTRREQESSKSMQFSTKASGGWGPFSAEASASGGTSSSLKDMSQSISKVATKAAKSVNSQNREEVSTTTTARTTIANIDETVATIRNINQGRSLNLMFYRLYNKYKGGLFLDGLRFDVIPSVEVIAGSGVHESKSYSLEDLPSMITEFKAAQLPFAINEEAYTNWLLSSIETLLRREYATDSGEESRAYASAPVVAAAPGAPAQPVDQPPAGGSPVEPRAEADSLSVKRLKFPSPEAYRVSPPAGGNGEGIKPMNLSVRGQPIEMEAGPTYADFRLAQLSEMLRRTAIDSNEPISPQELLVAAPGLYLDAVVGIQPSTEPYSEKMREQTVALKMAEVALTRADARYRESLAQHLMPDGSNWIVDIEPNERHNTLTFFLKQPLAAGKWDALLDGKKLCDVPAKQLGKVAVQLVWDIHQDWLNDGLKNRCLELREREKGTVLERV